MTSILPENAGCTACAPSADTINELHNESDPVGAAFKNSLEITQAHCEDLVGKGFKVTPETGGYLNDIAIKIDTVLRKNYIEIKK